MTTQEKIAAIIEDQFHGYRGHHPYVVATKKLHRKIRQVEGDEKFLEFLEKSVKENPRPVYKSPYIP